MGLLCLLACETNQLQHIQSPEVPGARSLLIAIAAGEELIVTAQELRAGAPLLTREVSGGSAVELSLIFYAEELAALGLEAGSVGARSSLDPLPPFLETYQLTLEGDDGAEFERVDELGEPLLSHLYPHPEGCTEVSRGGREYCVPNGCTGDCARDFCFDPPEPWTGLDSVSPHDGVSTVREGGEVWLYFLTRHWASTSTGPASRGDHAKVRLIDASTAELASLTKLDNLPPTELTHVSRPSVTRDGLELIFSALPEGRQSEQVFVSQRSSLNAPFSRASFAISGLDAQDMLDPLIMLDPTMVLLWSGVPDKLTLFRRGSPEPGAVDFSADISLTPTLSPDPGMRLGNVASFARPNLSCDGWHLLLFRKFGDDVLPSTTLVTRHTPLELTPFQVVEDLRPPAGVRYTSWTEHSDCTAAYLSDGERLYIARRRRCE